MDMRVTSKKGVGFYVRAASVFLRGAEAAEPAEGRDARPARAPVEELRISGLGEAIGVAVAVAARAVADGLGEVAKVRTQQAELPGGGVCPQILIHVRRRAGAPGLPLAKHDPLPSVHIAPRPVHVWLPDGYEAGTDRYAVLYMHDGQNLFEKSESAFGTTWQAAEALSELIASGAARKTIIVGVFNGCATRFREYVPGPVVERLDAGTREKLLAQPQYGGPPLSAGYVRFLVEELKPFVDAEYRTKPDRANTFVMGSSMGGLISWHALALHPDVFGAAGCLSTHWPLTIDEPTLAEEAAGWRDTVCGAFRGYLEEVFPAAGSHRFWFDYGSENLDSHYEPYQQMADAVFAAKGYRQGQDLVTRAYPGADHNEASWAARLKEPLAFLLGE